MPDQNVTFTPGEAAAAGALATPSSGNPPGGATPTAGANGQVKGTDGADRATLETLRIDKDQVINLGAGNDVFIFRNNGNGRDDSYASINGIVDGGADNDSVYANGQLTDYVFTVRSDGGIKMEYIGESSAAVTFRNFESFVFRNIDSNGVDHGDQKFTYDALIAAINIGAGGANT